MTKEEVLQFANENPMTWMATVEGDKPHVRCMFMWFADETGFYYHTASTKRLFHQLQVNSQIELCFLQESENQGESQTVRVNGRVEFLNDDALAARLLQERPWLMQLAATMPGAEVAIFRVTDASAELWNMAINGHEAEQPVIAL